MSNQEYLITDINTFDISKIRWSISASSFKEGNATIPIYRAIPSIIGPNGRESPLIIATDKVFSYGVQEKPKQKGDGFEYSVPICVLDKNAPTAHQRRFIEVCDQISKSGRDFILTNKSAFKKDKMIKEDLRALNIIWHNGDDQPQTLYAKIPIKRGEMDCQFISPYKKNGQILERKMNPLLFRDQKGFVQASILVSDIFVGAKASFQTKIYELVVYPQFKKPRLLPLKVEEFDDLEDEGDDDEEESEEEDGDEQKESALDRMNPLNITIPVQGGTTYQPQEPVAPPQVLSTPVDEPKPRRGGRKKL